MAIATVDQLIAAAKQKLQFTKTGAMTTVATGWFDPFAIAGQPGAGTLAVGNTANGVFPTDATSGYPLITAFAGGATGYLSRVEFGSTVACRIAIFDTLFSCGAYAFNANTTLASQPSFSGRVPNTDYSGLELWAVQVTAATGNQTVNVTYTNQAGTASRTTGATGIGAAPTVGRAWQLPLQAGDSGVQSIQNVTGGTGSAGTFNVHVMRMLWAGRVMITNDGDTHGWDKVGMPVVYDTSALRMLVCPDSTALGVPDLQLDIVSG